MKLSAKPGLCYDVDVYLDGKKLGRVFEADDEAGYADVYMTEGDPPRIAHDKGRPVTKRLTGKIEIVWRSCHECGDLLPDDREARWSNAWFRRAFCSEKCGGKSALARSVIERDRVDVCSTSTVLMATPDPGLRCGPCRRMLKLAEACWHAGVDLQTGWVCTDCVPIGKYEAIEPKFIGKMPERVDLPFKQVEIDPNSPIDMCKELDAMWSDMIAALGVPADLLKDCPPSASLKEAAQGLGNKAIDHTKIGRQRRDLDAAFSPTSISPADSTGRNGTKLFPESVAPKCSPEYAGWASGDFKAEIAKVENEIKTQKSKLVEVEAWIIDLSYKRSALTRGLAETVKRNGEVKS